MKHLPLVLSLTATLLCSQSIAEDLIIRPGTEAWKELYEPDATNPVEIQRTDPLRKKLFSLARPGIEKKAGKTVLFNGSLKGYRNWALFQGSIEDKSGKPIYFDEFESNAAVALFIRTVNGWVLVDSEGGHTDVFYEIWIEVYGMPSELLSN